MNDNSREEADQYARQQARSQLDHHQNVIAPIVDSAQTLFSTLAEDAPLYLDAVSAEEILLLFGEAFVKQFNGYYGLTECTDPDPTAPEEPDLVLVKK